MARGGAGVSVTQGKGSSWRVQWRETVVQDGQPRQVHRERARPDEAEARKLQGRIIEWLEDGLVPTVELERETLRPGRGSCTVDAIVEGWIRDRAGRGYAPQTMEGAATDTTRILRTLRKLEGLPDGRAIPIGCLTRDAAIRLRNELQGQGFADTTVNGTIGALIDLWTWASDDPTTYPGVLPPPRHTKALRIRVTKKVAPPAPSLAACDAVVRIVAKMKGSHRVALPVAVVGRLAGLRSSQIMGIHTEDVNLSACTLLVRLGKSKAEKEDQRTVPMHPELRDFLTPYVARAQAEGREALWPRRTDSRTTDATQLARPDKTLRKAWQMATDAGDAILETWDPPGRAAGRPEHAFRAAFQAALVDAGVRDEVIDLLVGHHDSSTRGEHYVPADRRMPAMLDAIGRLSGIDWRDARKEAQPDNVVRPNFGR